MSEVWSDFASPTRVRARQPEPKLLDRHRPKPRVPAQPMAVQFQSSLLAAIQNQQRGQLPPMGLVQQQTQQRMNSALFGSRLGGGLFG